MRNLNQKAKKLITMYKTLHLIDGINWLYMKRKEEGRWLVSIENWMDSDVKAKHSNDILIMRNGDVNIKHKRRMQQVDLEWIQNRHSKVGRETHCKLCKWLRSDHANQWYTSGYDTKMNLWMRLHFESFGERRVDSSSTPNRSSIAY